MYKVKEYFTIHYWGREKEGFYTATKSDKLSAESCTGIGVVTDFLGTVFVPSV